VKTTTHHHRNGEGKALCVKCYDLARDVPKGAEGTDEQQQRAEQLVSSRWWSLARKMAREKFGFDNVYSAGRSGGWLYTDPLPDPVTDEDGDYVGPGDYPPAFVAELSALLDRAPAMYAETLADIIAEDASDAAEAAERAAMPARFALALLQCMPHVDRARELTGGDGDIAAANSRRALGDYLDQLQADEDQRDLTDDEARALAGIAAYLKA